MSRSPQPMKHISFSPERVRHSVGIVCEPISLYYENILPVEETNKPTIVMLHGGSHSGSCYQVTMDGRPGWAYYFARNGYPSIVPDWPQMGRSGTSSDGELTSEDICQAVSGLLRVIKPPVVLLTHSMGGAFGWRIYEANADRICGIVGIAPGPPGNIQPIPTMKLADDGTLEVKTPFRNVRVEPGHRIRNSNSFVRDKLIGASAHFPKDAFDLYADSLLETPASLLKQRMNIDGSQIRVSDPACLTGLPVLIVTGSEDLEHPKEEDLLIVEWLSSCGANPAFLWLADRGIVGNGHMMMIESNSDAIADQILTWLGAL